MSSKLTIILFLIISTSFILNTPFIDASEVTGTLSNGIQTTNQPPSNATQSTFFTVVNPGTTLSTNTSWELPFWLKITIVILLVAEVLALMLIEFKKRKRQLDPLETLP